MLYDQFDFYVIMAGCSKKTPLKKAFPGKKIEGLRDGYKRYGTKMYPRYWYTVSLEYPSASISKAELDQKIEGIRKSIDTSEITVYPKYIARD